MRGCTIGRELPALAAFRAVGRAFALACIEEEQYWQDLAQRVPHVPREVAVYPEWHPRAGEVVESDTPEKDRFYVSIEAARELVADPRADVFDRKAARAVLEYVDRRRDG